MEKPYPKNEKKKGKDDGKDRPQKLDLAKIAEESGLDFDKFSEEIFIAAISLGLLVNEGDVNLPPTATFKFSYPDQKGVCELYVRRVPKNKIITPKDKEKKIILN